MRPLILLAARAHAMRPYAAHAIMATLRLPERKGGQISVAVNGLSKLTFDERYFFDFVSNGKQRTGSFNVDDFRSHVFLMTVIAGKSQDGDVGFKIFEFMLTLVGREK